ncbi:MAG: glycosyl hydrolase [Lachnospiraceae bacterium]|nr:glycosyl hydrolase [Lachnospiraceae bacterium]
MAAFYHYDLNHPEAEGTLFRKNGTELAGCLKPAEGRYVLELKQDYSAVYGMGERFNRVNQKGLNVHCEVEEKFCNQGSVSYCPIPFFFTDKGYGIYVDTLTVVDFSFEETISIFIGKNSEGKWPGIYLFEGSPKEILEAFSEVTGKPAVTPKWSLGPWMSANRWHTQEEVREQLSLMEKHGLPHTVLVVEAWSDEATFYRFNEHGEWPDPAALIKEMKEKGVQLVLWQIPVLKRMDNDEPHPVLDADKEYAVTHELCIKNKDGSPYKIPENHWFAGSYLPDFTNPGTKEWWFGKRQYLLDMGVAGFKTDGGEFVLTDDVICHSGLTGLELRNDFVSEYVKAYTEFIGPDRVLFSRAGYTGQQKYPMQWAGDQMSSWEEFRHIVCAGLSAGLSGISLWGFDIGGFAADMPSQELYERAVQMAVFAPVMQWHSEPVGGQFAEICPSAKGINDRSPWNISELYRDETMMSRMQFQFRLRMNLLPYLYQQSLLSGRTGVPVMKHLILEYPQDEHVRNVEDCFMLGDLLAAPVLEPGKTRRSVYLPEGEWYSLWPMDAYDAAGNAAADRSRFRGGQAYVFECGAEKIPVFLRAGGCIALNLDDTLLLGSDVGNRTDGYANLCFYMAGDNGCYEFADDLGNEICLTRKGGQDFIDVKKGNAAVKILSRL